MGVMIDTTCLYSNFALTRVVKVKGADTWSSSFQGRAASSVATASFFVTRSGVVLFYLGLWSICWKLAVFDSSHIFVNVCRITVFSIQEYSSFTGVICAESVTSADVSSGARLYNQIQKIVW